MKQTKVESLIEQVCSTAVGFVVSFAAWQLIGPAMGYKVTFASNFIITSLFTVLSIARGYVMRRFFNAGLHRAVHNFVRRYYVEHRKAGRLAEQSEQR